MMRNCDPELVQIELDASNMMVAGVDPFAYLEQYNGRCPVFHLKDQIEGKKRGSVILGDGELDIERAIETGRKTGVQWMVVEQDFREDASDPSGYRTSDFECAEGSFNVLKHHGFLD